MEENYRPSKSLVVINVLVRVFYILSIAFMILNIIDAVAGLSGCIILLSDKDKLIGPEHIPLWQKILTESLSHGYKISLYTIALLLLNFSLYSMAMFVMYNFARKYFKSVLIDNTPFTEKSGKGMHKLGLLFIITGVAMMIVCLICYGIFSGIFHNDRGGVSFIGLGWSGFGTGLVFLIISLFINAANDMVRNNTNSTKNN